MARRGLTADEKALWSRIAATAVPMHGPATVHGAAHGADDPEPAAPPVSRVPAQPPTVTPPDFRIGATPIKPSTRIDLAPHPGRALHDQPLRMDHKTHRRMAQGKLVPEARIDLHGMTLNAAQPALTRFVLNARASGLRLVLVITGKGRDIGPEAPLPVRPGALRHNVPHWLHMAPLSQLVLQVRPAHRRHGGEGAYYVYLRR
ncbi:DNA mismatch repair protein MutS [Paracoccus limosus]|jgi:DNA-nicking Smr family endonuclease|uniref:DNA mismatch repair protein MutS n=1 Tax=Paracoccus limosus TaxID=913252 RepID=A0A844H1A8_9RHOB|nr:Smr/MutS family protein [Paracoccus limosus]MTH33334.1 DNA mismatch repair protein MutS [Paracoccus limosus]